MPAEAICSQRAELVFDDAGEGGVHKKRVDPFPEGVVTRVHIRRRHGPTRLAQHAVPKGTFATRRVGAPGLERPCKRRLLHLRGVRRGVRRVYPSEQFRAVDLSVVHQDVRVRVCRRREVALPDMRPDLGPAHTLVTQEADPPVTEIVRRERGHSRIPAGAGDRHPQAIGRADREERARGGSSQAGSLSTTTRKRSSAVSTSVDGRLETARERATPSALIQVPIFAAATSPTRAPVASSARSPNR